MKALIFSILLSCAAPAFAQTQLVVFPAPLKSQPVIAPADIPLPASLPAGVTQEEYKLTYAIFEELVHNHYQTPAFRWTIVPTATLNSDSIISEHLIRVYTSMIVFLARDPGELAFVVAHEMGHLLDPSCENWASSTILPAIAQQQCEKRADELGLQLLIGAGDGKAGGNPYDAAAFFGRLTMVQGDTGLNKIFVAFTSNHPVNEDRIANLRKLIAQLCANRSLTCR